MAHGLTGHVTRIDGSWRFVRQRGRLVSGQGLAFVLVTHGYSQLSPSGLWQLGRYWLWEGSSPGFARCPAVAPSPPLWHRVASGTVSASSTDGISQQRRHPSATAVSGDTRQRNHGFPASQHNGYGSITVSTCLAATGTTTPHPPCFIPACMCRMRMPYCPPLPTPPMHHCLHPHPCLPPSTPAYATAPITPTHHHPTSTPGTPPLGARPAGSSELATHTGASPSNPLLANMSVHHCIIGIY